MLDSSRASSYYQPKLVSGDDLSLMQQIDRIHTDKPFLGSRRIVDALADQGYLVNRKRVSRLMRLMGIQAIHPGPKTSQPHPQHKIYPYLLRNLSIDGANQVWASDVTYIPMESGFIYLTVIMDWYSRKELSWRLSNSLDSSFCVDALEEPSAAFIKELRDPRLSGIFSESGVDLGEDFASLSESEAVEMLGQEFTRLFVGPGAHISAHESVFTDLWPN